MFMAPKLGSAGDASQRGGIGRVGADALGCCQEQMVFPGPWTETFGTERLTGALLDRLTHHIHILEMNGESFRLNHSRSRNKAVAG